jgi:uncharacterized damage-inducible protein DinB
MSQRFEHCDMGGTIFEDVNLRGARFRDVNLADVVIEDAYIKGMTVFGLRVDELIEAEMDRREPERARLRISDPADPACARAVLARQEYLRGEFVARLRAASLQALTARPCEGEWSALETARHMLYVEDLYLNRHLLANDAPRNRYGLPPSFAHLAAEPCDNLEAVLAAWVEVHAGMCAFVAALTPETLRSEVRNPEGRLVPVSAILQLLAWHDLAHIRQAERALAAAGAL